MNSQRLTKKSIEAIQQAQSLSVERDHLNLDCEHVLLALLEQEDGLIPALLKRMGTDTESIKKAVEAALSRMPGVTGPGREADKIYVTPDLDKTLNAAEKLADSMSDDYISVEHLFMALIEYGNRNVKDIFRQYSINKEDFLKVLASSRVDTRVTRYSPEEASDVFKKYSDNLYALGRQQKLD